MIVRLAAAVSSVAVFLAAQPASAETMSSALSRAYENNPDINQQRAATRAKDEGVPSAKAGWLPKASATYSAGHQVTNMVDSPGTLGAKQKYVSNPRGPGATISQVIFDGGRTANNVRAAESTVLMARENTRYTELQTLQQAATAYMDVLRDIAIVSLRNQNIKVLQAQVKSTTDRYKFGEVTKTDVAQAQASLANGGADLAVAQSNLDTSMASFRRLIGVTPRELAPAQPIEKMLPPTLTEAIRIGLDEHPQIVSALDQVDVSEAQVKVAEAALLPTAGVQAAVQQQMDLSGYTNYSQASVSITGQINIPIYQGGSEYAAVRQAKEIVGQARLAVDSQRIVVRGAISTAWSQLAAARSAITAYQSAVKAAEIALNGVRDEAKVGQRTTLDVLNAQQTLLNARVQLVTAQHDRVVGSYNVMAGIGRLSAANLGLNAPAYNPEIHFEATKNRFIGLTTAPSR